ncbi:MAG: hypothetical protein WCO11_09870 [Sphingomonadales bacterium]|jgi:hypothetical protein
MARYTVTSLKAVETPAGPVLERISGPGWLATPPSLIDLMATGGHEFQFDDGIHALALRNDAQGYERVVVVNRSGEEVTPSDLPHWTIEVHRGSQVTRQTWWQRLLDPGAR